MAFKWPAIFGKKDYTSNVTTVPGDRGNWWFPVVNEPFTGAWQRNIQHRPENVLAFHAVYACIERIASDIAKCRLRLVEQDNDGIWDAVKIDVGQHLRSERARRSWRRGAALRARSDLRPGAGRA
jgi:hypothetical protein